MRPGTRKSKTHPDTAPLPQRAPRKTGKRVWLVSRYEKQRSSVAEALATQLHRTVQRIDLSKVVSPHIGETEKNLARVFAEAEGKEWVLFFDEADALFSERGDARNAYEKHNTEQLRTFFRQLESSTSPVIVASRRKHSLDPAFVRRLRMSVVTPLPIPKVRQRRLSPSRAGD